ncbi:hypothetical protein BU24DRAFT_473639 [Aaosphaeria arxii CBS 175.79]|uniref:ubiquitinyl hydrolase 1 n=1 Tax=Aaosphaeria arxii CBS 175.79 TaxID=1450172 RepID=A0A6A5X992_9PLEO|nr:uncharacterized protein BU24DRAFT_473639 [Aaosphaeria arxii CBS 175.79]KAF2009480.1 hypothetical protein BU24DRAFT_473639 [Aaosphaeria arxii CBS 175.79]
MAPFNEISSGTLRYLIDHVVLPPQLPQKDDRDVSEEWQLLDVTILALKDLERSVSKPYAKTVKSAIATIENLRDSRDGSGILGQTKTQRVLTRLSRGDSDGYAPLEINTQNAAVIAIRCEDGVRFELMELSPNNEAVMKTKGRLTRVFPALAAKVASVDMQDPAIVSSLARTMSTLAVQKAPGMQPRVSKNGYTVEEDRDTSKPDMVTDWLFHLLTAMGNTAKTDQITKNTRDDVLWSDCRSPWRRSPLWLLVRVSLHLLFSRALPATDPPDGLYKGFMIHMLLQLLKMATSNPSCMENESIHTISAKLCRRLRKFELLNQDQYFQPHWLAEVSNIVQNAHKLLENCWRNTEAPAQPRLDNKNLPELQPDKDLDIDIPDLDLFLSQVASRQGNASCSSFDPTSMYPTYLADDLPSLSYYPGEQRHFRLAALEMWVEHHLSSWLALHIQETNTCGKLRQLMKSYFPHASAVYKEVPINLSIMYLTILELIHPMLKHYDHELVLDECECLVLPLKSQMRRLADVEQYAISRRTAATRKAISVFRDFGHPMSFGVAYYDSSPSLKDTHARIERDASARQEQKYQELERVQREHKALMDRYNDPQTQCDYYDEVYDYYHNYKRKAHSKYCAKCDLPNQARNKSIEIYEWPLSPEPLKAKATVFELQVPQEYSDWRDTSIFVITNVLGFRDKGSGKPRYQGTLDNHHGLSQILTSDYHKRRIVPLSEVKSHTTTHRRNKTGVQYLKNHDVCLKNALKYEYFDTELGVCNARVQSSQSIPKKCGYSMPNRSKSLQRFMYKPPSGRDGPFPNEIMANLVDCPSHFSIDEFKAFAALPLGHKTVYYSILTQLAMPAVDFAKAEVQSLILQIIHQTGPPKDDHVERASHHILVEGQFGLAMLAQLQSAIERSSENWESWRAVASYIQLAQRVLSMTSSLEVRQKSLRFLEYARKICLKWILRLKDRVSRSTDEAQRIELRSRMAEIALICTNTYDVEPEIIEEILLEPSTVTNLLQSSIVVQENVDTIQSDDKKLWNILLHAWRSMMYRIGESLLRTILQNNAGLNEALSANWADFQPRASAKWSVLDDSRKNWLQIKSGVLPVHFNILTAELLYRKHEMYKPLFGGSTLEVVPTSEPGMRFSVMLVTAVANDTRWELIPARVLRHRLPIAYIRDFIHWYNHNTGEVFFRPRENPWTTSEDQWRLQRIGNQWRLAMKESIVVSKSSHTANSLSRMFSRVEHRRHIHIVLHTTSSIVQIMLPRLQLDFTFHPQHHDIHSRQYRGMVIDPDQSIGTLVGLTSMLVLKSTNKLQDRLVLIPVSRKFGPNEIVYDKSNYLNHVNVCIDKDLVDKVFAYNLDSTIGRIVDSGNLQSKLLLAYLHALTSHCLPDLFTGYTGTESALNILRSAAVRSYDGLEGEDVDLLKLISAISPVRAFYPAHLMDMQTIVWNDRLPNLSQHSQIRECAQDIIVQAQRMHAIFGSTNNLALPKMQSSNEHLDARDSIRSSMFRTCTYGAESFTSKEDVRYKGRDNSHNSARGRQAYEASRLILRDEAALSQPVSDFKSRIVQLFRNDTVTGLQGQIDISSLQFDTRWMDELSSILQHNWCEFHRILSLKGTNSNKYDVAAWLSTLAYSTSANMNALQALAGLHNLPDLSTIQPPPGPSFALSYGERFNQNEVRGFARRALKGFRDSAEARLPKQGVESERQHSDRIKNLFQQRCNTALEAFVSALEHQWPCLRPSNPITPEIVTYVNVSNAMSNVSSMFETWYHNRLFLEYLKQVSTILARQTVVKVEQFQVVPPQLKKKSIVDDSLRYSSMKNIFQSGLSASLSGTVATPAEPEVPAILHHPSEDKSNMKRRIRKLCDDLDMQAVAKCEKDYVQTLRASCASLEVQGTDIDDFSPALEETTVGVFQTYLATCTTNMTSNDQALIDSPPRISPSFWLAQLNLDRFKSLSIAWKKTIINYGLAITQLHRAQRLDALSRRPAELAEELQHVGHCNWDPTEHPETLLLEAESKIVLREEQEYIASRMRDPVEGKNIVLQLVMGAGKSSTIVPVLAASLADTKTLVRVIVAKPQSKQMLQFLITKLGGMLNRRIYQMPFSRSVRLQPSDALKLREMYQGCIQNRGVLLVQPEHLLSFKLMGIESLLSENGALAKRLLETQQFFDTVSRDIVDESDLNYSPKFELVYTMGAQQPIEYAPERWLVIQSILGLLPRIAAHVKTLHPKGVELENEQDGRFPRIRILNMKAADCLLSEVARHVVDYGIVGLPTRSQPPDIQASIFRYITESDLTGEEIDAVEKSKFWTDLTKAPLLLVRGLIAGGVLRFVLSTKRWRVNFGLDSSREPNTSLAVPYRSKDSPSPRSEFSHPEVVILLCLLSYYYGGLNDESLFDAIGHLAKSDQSIVHYDEWISTTASDLPIAFKHLSGVSIRDRHQCTVELFPALRYSKKAIDYFLSALVFPKEMKQFPKKLSASGWDLGAVKSKPTCGFSGTNDTHHLLPLNVHHIDLPSQSHTNALVISYLLKDETSVQVLPLRTVNSDADHLLTFINSLSPEVRVLLDCGASILEQNNKEVAQTWLRLRTQEIQAAVFFDDEELSVLDRTGRVEAFQTSPFAKQLDVCIVYLDEAHTRGTDLRLPRNYRASVTLGAQLTKDTLTQACMRMRQLGKGQAITFIVPDEIATKIRERTGISTEIEINVNHVLCWSIGETWDDLKRSMPLWAVQGHRYESHKHLFKGAETTLADAKAFLEDEAQTIQERYQPRTREQASNKLTEDWDTSDETVMKIITRCRDFEAMGFSAAALSEEQERELAPEIEEERQVERPRRMKPEKHRLHPYLVQLATTGVIPNAPGPAFRSAFRLLASTSTARLFNLDEFPLDLHATIDYIDTVKPPKGTAIASFVSDEYQRPVQWVMSVAGNDKVTWRFIILSPFEANALLDTVRKHSKVILHLFSPRFNSSFASLDELTLHTVGRAFDPSMVPRSLTVQLNLFAGSLYLRSFAEYKELCDFLGLLHGVAQEGQQVYADGFIDPPTGKWGLTKSPVPFLRTLLMKIRREGEGVEKTHLGRILNGVRLEETDFEEDQST